MHYKTRNGWTIEFKKNVHMYYHSLVAAKGRQVFDVSCENTPDGFVRIWPCELKLDTTIFQDLIEGLRDWAKHSGMSYRLYITAERYESND